MTGSLSCDRCPNDTPFYLCLDYDGDCGSFLDATEGEVCSVIPGSKDCTGCIVLGLSNLIVKLQAAGQLPLKCPA